MKVDKRFEEFWNEIWSSVASSKFTSKQAKFIKSLCHFFWSQGIVTNSLDQLVGHRHDIDAEGAR